MNIILFGCGQGGQMAARWLPADTKLIAFADNNPSRWGTCFDGVPVVEPGQIPFLAPDIVFITVINKDFAREIEEQLLTLGYSGKIKTLEPLRQMMDLRLAHLRLLSAEILRRDLPGAVAELGVYQGAFAAEINRLFPEKKLYLFDTFTGFDPKDVASEREHTSKSRASAGDFGDTSAEQVLSRLPFPKQAVLCKGHFPDTLPEDLPPLAFVNLDPDLYEPVLQGLYAFWPKLVPGGAIMIHDYNSTQFEGAGKAVRTFCDDKKLTALPLPDLHGSAVLIKQ